MLFTPTLTNGVVVLASRLLGPQDSDVCMHGVHACIDTDAQQVDYEYCMQINDINKFTLRHALYICLHQSLFFLSLCSTLSQHHQLHLNKQKELIFNNGHMHEHLYIYAYAN